MPIMDVVRIFQESPCVLVRGVTLKGEKGTGETLWGRKGFIAAAMRCKKSLSSPCSIIASGIVPLPMVRLR